MSKPVVALSGGFDPPTAGHVAMIQDARQLGKVVIILNSDEWCDKARWTGRRFIPFETRKKILECIPGVEKVLAAKDSDGTVCESLQELQPDFFGNGGERTPENTPEVQMCKDMGIGMLWFLGRIAGEDCHEMLKQAIMEGNRIPYK